MGLFPETAYQPTPSCISILSPECEQSNFLVSGSTISASAVVTQNLLYLFAVRIETPSTFVCMGWLNGATSNGNCAAGIYTMGGTRLDYTAHTAQGTISVAQSAALTNANVLLRPGLYYLAFGSDSATATFARSNAGINLARIWGAAQVSAAYANPLPASITPAWPPTATQPFVWASTVAAQ